MKMSAVATFQFLIFFSIVSGLVFFLTYLLLVTRLGITDTNKIRWIRVGFATAWALLICAPVYYRGASPKPDEPLAYGLNLFTYAVMGWVGIYLIYAFALEVIQALTKAFDPQKRIFLTEGVTKGLIGFVSASTLIGYIQAKRGPNIKEVDVPLENLPSEWDGLVITQISDVHIGPLLHRGFSEQIVEQVLSTKPDIIVVTGDLVDGSVEQLKDHVAPLAGLRAPLGTFFCTGNHEYYSGAEDWIAEVSRLGMIPLTNSNRILERNNAKIMMAGVYDYRAGTVHPTHKHDPKEAAQTSAEGVAVKILLAHQPKSITLADEAGFDLQLSGHTHAGQLYPFSWIVRLVHRYNEGLYRHNERMWIYVNRGTGYWGPPNRFGLPGEITRLTLRRQSPS
jgi:uncharacterized protein